MVDEQLLGRDITSPRVLEALRKVPRHLFIPEPQRARAYDDSPVPIGLGQTISQPYIVAFMTQALDVEPGHRVLEIGTGSGYQAAVLAELTREVYSIEVLPELARTGPRDADGARVSRRAAADRQRVSRLARARAVRSHHRDRGAAGGAAGAGRSS